MPTKSKRVKLSDIRQGKTFFSVDIYRKIDMSVKPIVRTTKTLVVSYLLNGKIRKDDKSIFVGTNLGEICFCGKDGIINKDTCFIFTKRKAAIKYAANF